MPYLTQDGRKSSSTLNPPMPHSRTAHLQASDQHYPIQNNISGQFCRGICWNRGVVLLGGSLGKVVLSFRAKRPELDLLFFRESIPFAMRKKGLFAFNRIIKDVDAGFVIRDISRAHPLVDMSVYIAEDGSCVHCISLGIFADKVENRDGVRTYPLRCHGDTSPHKPICASVPAFSGSRW